MRYKWKPGTRVKISANTAGRRMRALYKRYGKLTTDILKNDAVKKNSPLRGHFEWNNNTAAENYRTAQAYELLRFITFVPENEEDNADAEGIRVYFPITIEVDGDSDEETPLLIATQTVYKDTLDIMNDPDERQQLLARALKELKAFREKYKMLRALARAVQRVINQLSRKRTIKKKTPGNKKRTK